MPFVASSSMRSLVAATALLSLFFGGCVQRRMTIRSNPPGAQVYVDDQEIGRTPVSTDFTYYGKRNIRLVKDGFETLTVKQSVWAPWYEWPGLEFISENLWPWEIRDERAFDYQMQPAMVVPSQTLLGRAEELRRSQAVSPAATPIVVAPAPAAAAPVPGSPPPSSPFTIPSPQPGAPPQYVPPPAVLNYPPNDGAPNYAPAPSYAPPTGVSPPMHLPGDFGGRPVPPMP
jgi:hypothetical protein